MKLTVAEALQVHPFSEATLIAGKRGTARIIRSVNIMDAPDIQLWTKEGEMLFTTAYIMKDSPLDALKILRELNDKGCSGLGIKLGRYWKEIPEILIEEADRLGFPLLELPYEFTFADQIQALFHADYQMQRFELQQTLDTKGQKLTSISTKMLESFEMVADILDYPIVILSNGDQVLFNNSEWTDIEMIENHSSSLTKDYQIYQDADDLIELFILVPPSQTVTTDEEMEFGQIAEILSHHLQSDSLENNESLLEYRSKIVLERFFEDQMSLEDMLDFLTEPEHDLLGGSYVCSLAIAPKAKSGKSLDFLRRAAQSQPELGKRGARHYLIHGNMFSIHPLESGTTLEELAAVWSELLEANQLQLSLKIYMSNEKRSPHSLKEGYAECQESQLISEHYHFQDSVSLYDNLELIGLLRHIPLAYMEKYYNRLLHPLLEKEGQYSKEMIHTLDTFLQSNGQVNQTAEKLFVHRNTVLYRLEKIGELMNIDLKKTNDLLRLRMAFLFKQLNEGEDRLRQ